MAGYEGYEGVFDMDVVNISASIMDARELARIRSIIANLKIYDENPHMLTETYTNILCDDNVAFILTKVSQDPIFMRHFPEFYEVNKYGENVINCQQNSPYHKYGVFKHILTTIEAVGNPQIPISDWQKKVLKWTMLLHDIGKPYVKTISEEGNESFVGHDEKSVELAQGILDRFEFSDDEKKIILKLIKYHDKFLNEGEITYDNMKFLANELGNSKELFYLLIDVKDSDAKAKSMEVYNKYKLTKNKYLEFVNSYFSSNNMTTNDETIKNKEDDSQFDEMTQLELENLVNDIISKKKIKAVFQPVIDLQSCSVYGYETFTRIQSTKRIEIIELLNYAIETGKNERVQQSLFINGVEEFEKIVNKEANVLFVNTDLVSYEKYINKPRLYDMMSRNKIVVEFHNYEKQDLTRLQLVIQSIHEHNGLVALDQFGTGTLNIDDINFLDLDYIIPDMSLIRGIANDIEKQKYMNELVTFGIVKGTSILVVGVESKEELDVLRKFGVKLVQGYYFEKPSDTINMINTNIKELLNQAVDDTIY
ncbi:MAG: EAL domain-containing protein [Clostridia bacterium]|nr:EAL domain-containing protein [Clostridia bacterium]